MQLGVADNAALADVAFLEFELRLDQNQEIGIWGRDRYDSGKDFCYGYEGNVHYDQVSEFSNIFRLEITRVAFDGDHARILLQFPIELVHGHIHGVNAPGPAMQQTIREAAGGAANVKANLVTRRDSEVLERAFKLQAAAARVAQRFSRDFHACVRRDGAARLVHLLAVDAPLARQQQRLRPLARWRKPALDDEHIEARLAGAFRLRTFHGGGSFYDRRATRNSASSRKREARSP